MRSFRRASYLAGILFAVSLSSPAQKSEEPKWIRVSSGHFTLLTDTSEKLGAQTVLRLEQMRTKIGQVLLKSKLHLSQPLDVIGVRSDEEYIRLAPVRDGRPIGKSGFFLAGDDRNYIVLNLADSNSWQTVLHEFAHLFLNYNYPPTQPWFDEGLAEYFSSLQLDDNQGQIGADPGELMPILSTQPWLTPAELFSTSFDTTHHGDPGKPIFRAQAWIVMHYLLANDKLPDTGVYFDWRLNQNLPVDQAIQKAYGVTADQLQQQVKEYFRGLPTAPRPPVPKGTPLPPVGAQPFIPLSVLDTASSAQPVPLPEAQALLGEMLVRLPEHRQAAVQDLEAAIADPVTETAVAHRALAWAYFEQRQPDDANDEVQKALELSPKDPWAHYYSARMKYRSALASGGHFPSLGNMLVNLRVVLDWNPDFAEAYNMLAMGRVEGGGINSAVEAMSHTVQLSPRNETYLLNMALVNMAAKKWDVATVILDRLKVSRNPEIAAAAKNYLQELPNAKKYGLLPKMEVLKSDANAPVPTKLPNTTQGARVSDDEENSEIPPEEKAPDLRKIQFSKGKIVRVDCSQPPAAVLTVAAGPKTVRLRTEDYHALLLLGTDQFSCEWKNVTVTANYKAGGKSDGDLVSLEVSQ